MSLQTHRQNIWWVTVVALLVVGCAPAQPVEDESVTQQDEKLDEGIWHVETGERLTADELIDQLEAAQFIVVGESHGQMWHHEVQNRIHRELSERAGDQVAVGMEMFERRFQPALGAYIAGDIDEEEMLQRVEWEKRWGFDKEYYASIWRRARQFEQPLIGLNATRELVRQVGEVGLEGLDEKDREALPDIDLDNREYRRVLREVFEAHPGGDDDEAFERFYEAQLVWDETMAETAFEYMEIAESMERMLVLAGRGHVQRGHGIPSRLVRRGADPKRVVTVIPVSTQGEAAEQMKEYRHLRFLRDEQISDVVWIQ